MLIMKRKMIKKTKIQKEVVERHKFCDVCGTEIRIGLACSSARCTYCRNDLCGNCIGHEEDTGGDFRIVWCKHCWDLGGYYRPKIKKLEFEMNRLYADWKGKCRSDSGKKKKEDG